MNGVAFCRRGKKMNSQRRSVKVQVNKSWASGDQVTGSTGVCVCASGCASVYWRGQGTEPRESGKRCHPYVNKTDSRERRGGAEGELGCFRVREDGRMEGWEDEWETGCHPHALFFAVRSFYSQFFFLDV